MQQSYSAFQTVLAAVVALALLVPMVLLSGLFALLLQFLQGNGAVIFFIRLFQYGLAAGACVYLPHLALKRSDPKIVATVLVTTILVLGLAGLIASGIRHNLPTSVGAWVELVGSYIGGIVGAFVGVQMIRNNPPVLKREPESRAVEGSW